ncbi:MAG: O-antigen ligase family protein [Patescibacteria group bacterium]
MDKKFSRLLRRALKYAFYLWVFLLPWQTKLILRPGGNNFQEISLYLSHGLLVLILVGFFVYKLRYRADDEKISPLWVSLAGLEILIMASFFVASDQLLAFYHYLLLLIGIGLFYLLRAGTETIGYEETFLDKLKVLYCLFASLFLQAGLGIYQFLSQQAPASKYFGLAAHDANVLGTAVVEAASGRWLRAYGGLDHPNIFGGVLAVALIIAAYLLAKKKMIRSGREAAESVWLFLFYFVSLFALFFTFSRAAWLAYALGLAGLAITLAGKKDRWILGRFIALAFFSLVMILIVAYPYRELWQARTGGTARLEQKSLMEREAYLGQAADLIGDYPLLGTGIGNYTTALALRDGERQEPWAYQPVHNVFLLLWTEAGFAALLFFLSFLFWLLKKNRREAFSLAAMLALLVLMLFDHWLFSLPFGLVFLFLVLGLL